MKTAVAFGALSLAALSLVGCGSSERGVVSAPSATVIAPSASVAVAPREGTSTPITVTSIVDGTSCPTLEFMVQTYVFRVSASTQYTGGTCANLQAGSRINFTGTRETPTALVFDVATLQFATTTTTPTPPPAPTPPTPVQTDVTITSIGAGMCPELQFFVNTYAFNVSYATQYTGGTCADLRTGARVAIVGTKKDTENFIRIASLTFRQTTGGSPTPTTPSRPTGQPVDGEGVITTLRSGTTCPSLSFFIGRYLVVLDASTVFTRGACSDLATGVRVHVTGTISDTAVAATQIAVQSDSPGRPVVEGEGRVSRLVAGTSCPALSLMIGEYTVMLDESTTLVGGACTDVAPGRQLGVKGVVTGERQVLATQIVFKNSDDRP